MPNGSHQCYRSGPQWQLQGAMQGYGGKKELGKSTDGTTLSVLLYCSHPPPTDRYQCASQLFIGICLAPPEVHMSKPQHPAHCPSRNVSVNLQQGFHQCIQDHQCFSDEPCPLHGKFAPPLDAKVRITNAELESKEGKARSQRD